jgi:RimJ/RimL family protein N-acetyltransferase
MDYSQTKIKTPRLALIANTCDFAEAIFNEYRDPITRTMNHPAPSCLREVEARIESRVEEMRAGEGLSLIALTKDTGEFLGVFALEDLGSKTPEMGCWLKHAAHGRGYGREAALAVKNWACNNLSFDYLVWPCMVTNTASRKIAEALGGHIAKEYEKTTAQGVHSSYVEYHIPSNN